MHQNPLFCGNELLHNQLENIIEKGEKCCFFSIFNFFKDIIFTLSLKSLSIYTVL